MVEKAFGYIRVSGGSQVEGDGPKRQKAAIEQFASAHGIELAKYFSDLAVSGTIDGMDRPAFADMIAECESLGCKTIIVEKIERFARDLMVSELLFRELRTRGIKLLATDQGSADLVSSEGDPSRVLIRQLFGALAQYEKSSLVIKLRLARERAFREKGTKCGVKPYGETGGPEATLERRILELIDQLREANAEWETVAVALTRAGFKKRSGSSKWTRADAWKLFRRHTDRQNKNSSKKVKI